MSNKADGKKFCYTALVRGPGFILRDLKAEREKASKKIAELRARCNKDIAAVLRTLDFETNALIQNNPRCLSDDADTKSKLIAFSNRVKAFEDQCNAAGCDPNLASQVMEG